MEVLLTSSELKSRTFSREGIHGRQTHSAWHSTRHWEMLAVVEFVNRGERASSAVGGGNP